jgi:hypothetical protein
MNDPHVEALHYRIKHADSSDYDKAPPLKHEEPDFSTRIEKDEARIVMKGHHATAESARAVVEPFLRAWELSAALFDAADSFEFVFQRAEIIDRKPTPGAVHAQVMIALSNLTMTAHAHVGRAKYPDPPVGLARNGDVELMLDCYRMCCADRRRLGDACYFCLTVLERAAGDRRKAAVQFGIDFPVLSKIGELTAQKGGKDARKIDGAHTDYTPAERTWLQEALKTFVRRGAEVAHDPGGARKMITMSDLPKIP